MIIKVLELYIQKVLLILIISIELRAALNSLGGEAKSQPIFQMINDLVEEGTEDL